MKGQHFDFKKIEKRKKAKNISLQHESEGFLNYLSGKKSICTFGLGKKIVLFNNEKHLLGKDQNIAFV